MFSSGRSGAWETFRVFSLETQNVRKRKTTPSALLVQFLGALNPHGGPIYSRVLSAFSYTNPKNESRTAVESSRSSHARCMFSSRAVVVKGQWAVSVCGHMRVCVGGVTGYRRTHEANPNKANIAHMHNLEEVSGAKEGTDPKNTLIPNSTQNP